MLSYVPRLMDKNQLKKESAKTLLTEVDELCLAQRSNPSTQSTEILVLKLCPNLLEGNVEKGKEF